MKYFLLFLVLLTNCFFSVASTTAGPLSLDCPAYLRSNSKIDHAKLNSKGTVLLIHGGKPKNFDGQLVDQKSQSYLKNKPSHYLRRPIFKELSSKLNELGWDTVRYMRAGVYQNTIDYSVYNQNDLKSLMDQLKCTWSMLPKNKPRIIFAWSAGSVHASLLPLSEASAVIFLGGISTRPESIFGLELSKKNEEFKTLFSLKYDHRNEYDLKENWSYYSEHPHLPMLILHGEKDEKVPLAQALLWKKKLSHHDITLIVKKKANHAWGVNQDQADMQDLSFVINKWLGEKLIRRPQPSDLQKRQAPPLPLPPWR